MQVLPILWRAGGPLPVTKSSFFNSGIIVFWFLIQHFHITTIEDWTFVNFKYTKNKKQKKVDLMISKPFWGAESREKFQRWTTLRIATAPLVHDIKISCYRTRRWEWCVQFCETLTLIFLFSHSNFWLFSSAKPQFQNISQNSSAANWASTKSLKKQGPWKLPTSMPSSLG